MQQRLLGDHADLTGPVEGLRERLGRRVEIGVAPNEEPVVARELQDRLLAGAHALLPQTQPGGAVAEEHDVVDERAREPGVEDALGVAADDVQGARGGTVFGEDRQDDLAEEMHHPQRRRLGRLDDQRVAREQRHHPQRRIGARGVLRRVDADDAIGLAGEQDPALAILEGLRDLSERPVQALAGGRLEHPFDLPLRQTPRVALRHEHPDDLLGALEDARVHAVANLLAHGGGHAPQLPARPRRRLEGVEVVLILAKRAASRDERQILLPHLAAEFEGPFDLEGPAGVGDHRVGAHDVAPARAIAVFSAYVQGKRPHAAATGSRRLTFSGSSALDSNSPRWKRP
jgi:hypothetical protein